MLRRFEDGAMVVFKEMKTHLGSWGRVIEHMKQVKYDETNGRREKSSTQVYKS